MSESVNAASHAPEREWLELAVDVDGEAVEAVSELFGRYGYNKGVVIDEPYKQEGDGDNLEIDPSRPFTIRTYVVASDIKPERIDEIRKALWYLGQLRSIGELRLTTLQEQDWANAWKEHFPVHRISDHVIIRPPWRETGDIGPNDVVIELDPGMAFGTGLHPSTQLSMQGLEEVISPGAAVLDVGTGSGILAIAAIKLGAVHVDAVDVEPVAVRATQENAGRNGVADRLDVREGSVGPNEPFQGAYDVVLANIIARILIELADGLRDATRPGGHVVLAGIIESREADVLEVFTARGFALVTRRSFEDWVSLVLQRSE